MPADNYIRTCARPSCSRKAQHTSADGWCEECDHDADAFGADEYDRVREYDKLNGRPGLRDCERVTR